jgi:hypothetical protein
LSVKGEKKTEGRKQKAEGSQKQERYVTFVPLALTAYYLPPSAFCFLACVRYDAAVMN